MLCCDVRQHGIVPSVCARVCVCFICCGDNYCFHVQVSAIESLLVAEGVSKVIGWINDEVDATTTQEDIDSKVCTPCVCT